MHPIIVEEIPHSIKKYVKQIEKVTFPKQGCTSDVGILHTAKGRYVLKRAKREKYRKWLYKEYYVLKNIQALADFQSPSAYKFVQTAVIGWSGGTCGDARMIWPLLFALKAEFLPVKSALLFLRDTASRFHSTNFVILQKDCTSFSKQ
ncbi:MULTISPECIES: hypothetical protein [Priestia]|uniref:hypothetical protein n=1 Tax=Priestia TaxID=2800373 RepID=UPI001E49E58C|nr:MULTISPECIES: hypothetical protein [Priestia]MCM3792252.1 hypothetical protein [Priestia megaterium]